MVYVAVAVAIAVAAAIIYKILKRPKKPPAPKAVKLQADPTNVIADRQSKSTIMIQLIDQSGRPIAAMEDTEIRLSSTRGEWKQRC